MDSVKHIRQNMPFLDFYNNGKSSLTQGDLLVQF